MDRVDSWLNRQFGWRRAAVIWAMMCPLAVGLGGSSWLGTGFVKGAAFSVLAAIPFASLAAAAQLRWQKWNAGKQYLSWRMTVAIWCATAGLLLGRLTYQPFGGRNPGVVWFVQLALFAGAVVFWLLAKRRWPKVSRNGRSGASPGSASQ